MAPVTQRVLAKADSGTIWPLLPCTLSLSKSSGCMRAGASACTMTRWRRPALGKSLAYAEPSAVEITPLMASKLTPSALALSRSMSNCNCGASSRPSGRTWVSTLLFDANPSNWLRAPSRASWPRPARSCSRKLKPDDEPSSGMGGGLKGKMNASRMPLNAPKARPAKACAELPASLRSDQSLSVTNARAAFCPWPEKLKPSTLTMPCTSGCLSTKPSTCCMTASVRSRVAPGGNCTLTSIVPWSSAGKNEVGRRWYISAAPARMAR